MGAVRLRVFLGQPGTRDVAAHECIEPCALTRGELGRGFGMNPGNGAERLFNVVFGKLCNGLFVVDRLSLRFGSRNQFNCWGRQRCGKCGITLQQRDLLRHQLHLLLNELLDQSRWNGTARARIESRYQRLRRTEIGVGGGDKCRRHLLVEVRRKRVQRAILFHQLPKRDVDLECLLQLNRDLGQRQGVKTQFDKKHASVSVGHVNAGSIFQHRAQLADQVRKAILCNGSSDGRGGH